MKNYLFDVNSYLYSALVFLFFGIAFAIYCKLKLTTILIIPKIIEGAKFILQNIDDIFWVPVIMVIIYVLYLYQWFSVLIYIFSIGKFSERDKFWPYDSFLFDSSAQIFVCFQIFSFIWITSFWVIFRTLILILI